MTPVVGERWKHREGRIVKIVKVDAEHIGYRYELTTGGSGLWGRRKRPDQEMPVEEFGRLFSRIAA